MNFTQTIFKSITCVFCPTGTASAERISANFMARAKRGIFSKRYVNKHGVEKGARQITVPSLQRILTNRTYIGIKEIGVTKGKLELVSASWPPLISLELFNQVQERLQLNKNKYKPDEWKRHSFPLTELLVCGECGKHLGGKSGTSKTKQKHFYYGHPRQLNSDGVTHLKRCRVENVRAEKIEDTLLKSLKNLASDEKLLDHWLKIYVASTQDDRPAIQGKIKTLETDIMTFTRRNENLIERLSELPKEISADGIYKQIQINADKLKELNQTLETLKGDEKKLATQAVNRNGLLFRIKRTIQNLERSPVGKRRGLYSNLIKFAELHPTKIRLGVYAPVETTKKAVGENPAASSKFAFEPLRVGSCTVLNGA